MTDKPRLLIFAGSNGSGKTTFATDYLAIGAPGTPFVNVDDIAHAMTRDQGEGSLIGAGRAAIDEIRARMDLRESFAIETTLAGNWQMRVIEQTVELGYRVDAIYLWAGTPELAYARVQARVRLGGHDVPRGDVFRRFDRSLASLPRLIDLATETAVYDNREVIPRLVAVFAGDTNSVRDKGVLAEMFRNMPE